MAAPADFAPPLLRIQEKPPAPLAGWMRGWAGVHAVKISGCKHLGIPY